MRNNDCNNNHNPDQGVEMDQSIMRCNKRMVKHHDTHDDDQDDQDQLPLS